LDLSLLVSIPRVRVLICRRRDRRPRRSMLRLRAKEILANVTFSEKMEGKQ